MLRLNRLLVSKHLNQLSNVLMKTTYYYSSESLDKTLVFRPKVIEEEDNNWDSFLRTTNPELNLFGPHDRRAPLNGNIGISFEDAKTLEFKLVVQNLRNISRFDRNWIQTRDIDIEVLLSDCQQSRRKKFFRILKYQSLFAREMVSVIDNEKGIDCSGHDLSSQAIRQFAPLFPKSKRHELTERLTVVTISEKTVNDMTSYSEAIEVEREDFFKKFIAKAKAFCAELKRNDFWADFIDPYSGQPFLTDPTNDTLFETDDRFLHLGFKIEDLGCCKAIYHKQWATHVVVGTIFTTAPTNSPVLKKLMTESIKHLDSI